MPMTPIFLFSLPRSGSTLLQRILASNTRIATASEPHILIPLVYAQRLEGAYAEYNHRMVARGIGEFIKGLPEGQDSYREAAREFALTLYRQASHEGATHFLDKTPRYDLIAAEVMDLFPDAKYVFLWRNPLAVAASMVETFGKGQWIVHKYGVDFYRGLPDLVGLYEANRDRCHALRYEDLVSDPEHELREMARYLDLDFDPSMLTEFAGVKIAGFGDRTGTVRYRSISQKSADAWMGVLDTPGRKRWAQRYVTWLGEERLSAMGYSAHELQKQVDSIPTRPRDLVADVLPLMRSFVEPTLDPLALHERLQSVAWTGRRLAAALSRRAGRSQGEAPERS